MALQKQISDAEARQIGDQLGLDWTKVDLGQFRRGLEVELEHGARDPETNVTGDDMVLTGKIAWAHLKEFPDYYTRLDRLETEADAYWASGRSLTNPTVGKPTMTTRITFTDEELALLHLLLSRDLESSRVELHHTAGLPYREYIKRRMEQGQALLRKMDGVLPPLQTASAGEGHLP